MGGLLAGINMARLLTGQPLLVPPRESMMGSLLYYITHADPENFQPMKANMGLLPDLDERVRGKQQRYGVYAERAATALAGYLAEAAFTPIIQRDTGLAPVG